ncbi:MAG: hypothetical protein HY744_16655 [Deltaproteobacteria bacterium]|nr:hypothetical protein [Deltaproteobacteria bacterium]
MRILQSCLFGWVLAAALGWGCGGSPSAPSRDEVFYLHERGVIDGRFSWERYYPPLDRAETPRLPRRAGVSIFNDDVRLSRPIDWYLRTADYTPQRRQISYQSPRQFVFSIYERLDPVAQPWGEVLKRYEEEVKKEGSTILAARLPVSGANAQARGYLLKTKLASRPDYDNFAHEILVRSPQRILLVQIVHGENVEEAIDEMGAVLTSMLVY